jgi:hypothetical protein
VITRLRPATALSWLAAAVVLAGAAQQAAVAIGWLAIRPGGAAGHAYVLGPALVVLALLGFALFAASGLDVVVPAGPAIAIAAALLVVARFYAYDPYYAPAQRRMSEGGVLSGTWIVLVVACALVAALIAARSQRAGPVAVALACWLAFGTAFAAGFGH